MRKSTKTATVAARIAELRRKRAMSQEALAAAAGINRVTLARLEAGLHEPSLETLERLASALRTTLRVEFVEPRIGRKGGR